MKPARLTTTIAAAVLLFAGAGCSHLPGKPGFRPETMRPDQVHDFATLYRENCSACHGADGRGGAALPLNNPVYLAWAGRDHMLAVVANGVPNHLMPAFGYGGGGLLTDAQLQDIVDGMIAHWGKPAALVGTSAPAYAAEGKGDPAQGKAAFQTYCARCHGADGTGTANGVRGSIVDPTYLALISAQGLRDITVAGLPDAGMPDWRGEAGGHAMTDADVTNIVAWLRSHRTQFPGQPFPQQEPGPDGKTAASAARSER